MKCEKCNLDLSSKNFPYPDSNICERCLVGDKNPTALTFLFGLFSVLAGMVVLTLGAYYNFGIFAAIYVPINIFICYKIALRKIKHEPLNGFLLFVYYLIFTGLLGGILLVIGLHSILIWMGVSEEKTTSENIDTVDEEIGSNGIKSLDNKNLCPSCAYDIAENNLLRCPECNEELSVI